MVDILLIIAAAYALSCYATAAYITIRELRNFGLCDEGDDPAAAFTAYLMAFVLAPIAVPLYYWDMYHDNP